MTQSLLPAMRRHAALLLYGLHPADRRWLLSHIDPVGRAALASLVAELDRDEMRLMELPLEERLVLLSLPERDTALSEALAHSPALAALPSLTETEIAATAPRMSGRMLLLLLRAADQGFCARLWHALASSRRDDILKLGNIRPRIKPVLVEAIAAVFLAHARGEAVGVSPGSERGDK